MNEKRALYANAGKNRKRTWFIYGAIALLLLLVGAALGIYFGIVKPKQNNTGGKASSGSNSTSGSGGSVGGGGKSSLAISGGDGSNVTMDNGSSFTYTNSFGGTWYADPQNPFVSNAQAQSWVPALNQSWDWSNDKIYGVNLGGWLNTEPFIAPALYEKYANTSNAPVDEWTLSVAMAADTASGGLNQLEDHYKTFITERDFADIAAAGLNWVRIPIGYWAIEVRDGEPFLAKTSWTYFLKAIEWARKYGIRINLDLHALPGSQNGWNHSGRLGTVNVLNGNMGLANAQRALTYIRVIAEFISQPQYKDVVPMFSITNEPQAPVVGMPSLQSYYLQAYEIVRNVSGVGQGNGPMVMLHDGFEGPGNWAGFLTNSDRVGMDTHPYFAFSGQSTAAISSFAPQACSAWGPMMNNSMSAFGLTVAGEFSLATNDCGLFVNGVGLGTRYEGTFAGAGTNAVGSCEQWDNWESWTQDTKNQLQSFALSSMSALQNWFFWTWKIGNSTEFGSVRAPFWSYQLGIQQNWLPKDPRAAVGSCPNTAAFAGPLLAWQTGGAGAGSLAATDVAALPWPPATISNAGPVSVLPTYTATGPVPTLPAPTITATDPATTFNAGNGWANAQDTMMAYVPVTGCSYPDPWSGVSAPTPTAPCTGAGARRREAAPAAMTPM
ncbi:glycoside hydrolase family 5 protein [Hysterangium stoloniferum]|nr:glycoside hydrolase family 5 protein [Hysterangium stoloniferum]